MQLINVLAAAVLATSVSGQLFANPVVKNIAARVVYQDGSYGIMEKRQTSCAPGLNVCGTGCTAGPCCDASAGLACRVGETCATVNGELACCPTGFTCNAVRGCSNAVGSGCTPGSVTNGLLCCDAQAPLCLTSSNTPYCAGAAVSTTYAAAVPVDTGSTSVGSSSSSATSTSTETVYSTSTATETSLAGYTSNAMPTSTSSLAASTSASSTSTETVYSTSTETTLAGYTSNAMPTSTSSSFTSTATETVIVLPTGYTSTVVTYISGSQTMTTTVTTGVPITTASTSSESSSSTSTSTSTLTSTSTFTAIVSVYPISPNATTPSNSTGTMPEPTQQTGAAGRIETSFGMAFAAFMGLLWLL